jgi:hypothetical protein
VCLRSDEETIGDEMLRLAPFPRELEEYQARKRVEKEEREAVYHIVLDNGPNFCWVLRFQHGFECFTWAEEQMEKHVEETRLVKMQRQRE